MDLSATAPGGVSCQALRALTLIAKALFGCLVVLLPIGGAWAGGALAAMSGGPRWVPFVAAALVFPLLPLAWEAWAERRRRAAETVKAHILTLADRLLLRTLALSVVFLGVLLSASPRTLFDALCTRGDFVVEGAEGEVAARVGRGLLSLADTLDALYSGGRQHTFARPPEERRPDEPPTPSELNAGGVTPPPTLEEPPETGSTRTEHTTTQGADADVGRGPTAPAWPLEAVMHPLVLDLPADAERSWQAVARYLREHEPNDTRLVKALHDYLADRIAYDAVAYASGTYGDQRPDAVFARRRSVCAGYAQLFEAMASAVGLRVAYIVGTARHVGGSSVGVSHAWNAVQINDAWYLLDITWDAGSVDGSEFTKRYRTEYLFVPPDVLLMDHRPEEDAFQLVEHPIGQGEFFRRPISRPGMRRHGVTLRSPQRSSVTVRESFEVTLDNPRRHSLSATIQPVSGGEHVTCGFAQGADVRLRCDVPHSGRYQVWVFAAPEPHQEHEGIVGFEVVRD